MIWVVSILSYVIFKRVNLKWILQQICKTRFFEELLFSETEITLLNL